MCVKKNSVRAEKPSWAMASMVCMRAYVILAISETWRRDDPTREDNILRRNKTALREEHLKDAIVEVDEALKCVENSY